MGWDLSSVVLKDKEGAGVYASLFHVHQFAVRHPSIAVDQLHGLEHRVVVPDGVGEDSNGCTSVRFDLTTLQRQVEARGGSQKGLRSNVSVENERDERAGDWCG